MTSARLLKAGAVMSALGTSDAEEGLNKLIDLLAGLPASENTPALEVDLGLNLDVHLEREPSTRERAWLGERRAGFAVVLDRDVKTVIRRSDRALAELRAAMLGDQFDGDLLVMALVRGNWIAGCSIVQKPTSDDFVRDGSLTTIDNPTREPSPPYFVYGYPRDWRPATLTLGVTFLEEPYPSHVCAIIGANFFSAAFGEDRYEIKMNNGKAICRVRKPRRDRLYGIFWTY